MIAVALQAVTLSNASAGSNVWQSSSSQLLAHEFASTFLLGFCQAGDCNITVTKYNVDKAENSTIWFPGVGGNSSGSSAGIRGVILSLADKVRVDSALYSSNQGVEGIAELAYKVWRTTSSDAGSCMFFNGGCGTAPCTIDVDSNTKTCVDVEGRHGVTCAVSE